MTSNTLIFGFFLYSFIVYIIKKILYPCDSHPDKYQITRWETGHECALALSPDYWWAYRFKCKIKSKFKDNKMETLKLYVTKNNKVNLFFSVFLATICFVFYKLNPESFLSHTLCAVSVIRLFSRGYEISFAFACDIFQKNKSATGLTKHERIRLAFFSYLEIFIFSAAAYTSLPTITSVSQAIMLSLNVGTLTNVGYAFSGLKTPLEMHIIFVQVIASQSLVILTLAGYLSRDNKS